MKCTNTTIVNLPVDKVIELFDSFDNMKKWQPELQSVEHISGVSGQPGAKTKLVYKHGNRTTEMIETISVRDLPREFSGSYEMKGILNKMSNSFQDLGNGTTRWTSESEFIFNGWMKYIAWMTKGSFKKMSSKMMDQFKKFAEAK